MMGGTLWLLPEPLILASGSATRCTMLAKAGLPCEVCKPEVDERTLEIGLADDDKSDGRLALALARAKALAVCPLRPGRIVLAADQTLRCEGTLFHKARDPEEARAHLAALSGREHRLHSAFVLACDGRVLAEQVAEARLTMRALTPEFIAQYVALVGPVATASVGAYQLENLGIHLFERVEGSHSTILGLPLLPLLEALRRLGYLVT